MPDALRAFANIAHGNSSLVADLIGQKLGDYVDHRVRLRVGHGDGEVLRHRVPEGRDQASAVVLVATVRALKHHAGLEGDPRVDAKEGLAAVEGRANLRRHLGIVKTFGLPCVVAVTAARATQTTRWRSSRNWHWTPAHSAPRERRLLSGGAGAAAWPRPWPRQASSRTRSDTYDDDDSIEDEIRKVATKVYGAKDVIFYLDAQKKIRQYNDDGLDKLPICMAKTHLSLSSDPRC